MSDALKLDDEDYKYFQDNFKINEAMVPVRRNKRSNVVEALIDGNWEEITEKDVKKEYRIQFNFFPYDLEFSYDGGKTWWIYTDEKYMSDWEREYHRKQLADFEEWQLEQAILQDELRANDPAYQAMLAEQYAEWVESEREYYRQNGNVIDINTREVIENTPSSIVDYEELKMLKSVKQMINKIGYDKFQKFYERELDNTYMKYFEEVGDGDNPKLVFRHDWLADEIIKEIPNYRSNSGWYYYSNGIYEAGAEPLIEQQSQKKLGKESKNHRINETIRHIARERYVKEINMNEYDGQIVVENGILNLETGELQPHTHERFSTIKLPVSYDPKANNPIVINFIKSVVSEDTVPLILEMFGYTLVTHAKYKKAFMFTGSGDNGKSVMIDLIQAFLGEKNYTNVELQDLDKEKFSRANLLGKLANINADLSSERLRKTSIFKKVVAGDIVNAEFKGKDSFDFRPFSTLIFSANEIPYSDDSTDGFYTRWAFIPFPNKFEKGKNADPNMLGKLTTPEALSTLLNLAIKGLKQLYTNGKFTENEATTTVLQQYKTDSDTVSTFLEDRCEFVDEDVMLIKVKEMYEVYCSWCDDAGYEPIGKQTFNQQLRMKHSLKQRRKKINKNSSPWFWRGIRFEW